MKEYSPPIKIKLSDKDVSSVSVGVMFDRDGVMNIKAPPHEHIKTVQELEMIEGFYNTLGILAAVKDKVAIVVFTNQRWLSWDESNLDQFKKISETMNEYLIENVGYGIDVLYCCPHEHEDPNCNCRKPKPGMLLTGIADFGIQKDNWLVIGDTEHDMLAATAAHLNNLVLIKTDSPSDANIPLTNFIKAHGL